MTEKNGTRLEAQTDFEALADQIDGGADHYTAPPRAWKQRTKPYWDVHLHIVPYGLMFGIQAPKVGCGCRYITVFLGLFLLEFKETRCGYCS